MHTTLCFEDFTTVVLQTVGHSNIQKEGLHGVENIK